MAPPSRILAILGIATCLAGTPALADEQMAGMGGPSIITYVALDRLEIQSRDGQDARVWDAQAWIGGDLHKAWFKAEGEDVSSEGLESSEVQALYSRAVAPFWDLQIGLRHDFQPSPSRSFAVLGLQGLAPYRFEVDAAAFLSDDGDLSARVEVEYDLRLTGRFVLQPRIELDVAFSSVDELAIASGPEKIEAGLRLHYALRPDFAPYAGVEYARRLADNADLARQAGGDVDTFAVVAGLRFWF
jgi:copper resistance protein B